MKADITVAGLVIATAVVVDRVGAVHPMAREREPKAGAAFSRSAEL